MKYLLKIFILSSLFLCAMHSSAQVTSIQYALLLNPNTSLIDCFLYINEGQATTVRERVQFNAQFSLLIPTGGVVNVASSYMPLIDNQAFLGEQPVKWTISSKVKSPEINPEFDFYGLTPTLAPAGFYNKLEKGELIRIFSLRIEGENIDLGEIRLFDNEADPKSHESGMKNGDFSNGFTMGGYHQLFNGIRIIDQAEADYTSLGHEK